MPATTTKTRFLGSTVAIRADWTDPASSVTNWVGGVWLLTGRRVADIDDHLTALRAALEGRARLFGMDPEQLRAEIEMAIGRAESSDRD